MHSRTTQTATQQPYQYQALVQAPYSHGEYWHCAPVSVPVLMISGRGEGTGAAASAGRAEGADTAVSGERRGECTVPAVVERAGTLVALSFQQ